MTADNLIEIARAHEDDKIENAPPTIMVRWRKAQAHRAALLALVRRIAEMSPEDDEGRSCVFCGACPDKHTEDCLWLISQGAKP